MAARRRFDRLKSGKPGSFVDVNGDMWQANFDAATGRYYYWNLRTRATCWTKPKAHPIDAAADALKRRRESQHQQQQQSMSELVGDGYGGAKPSSRMARRGVRSTSSTYLNEPVHEYTHADAPGCSDEEPTAGEEPSARQLARRKRRAEREKKKAAKAAALIDRARSLSAAALAADADPDEAATRLARDLAAYIDLKPVGGGADDVQGSGAFPGRLARHGRSASLALIQAKPVHPTLPRGDFSSTAAPALPLNASDRCMRCEAPFADTRRKVCRCCGCLCCRRCCASPVLEVTLGVPVLVCDHCYRQSSRIHHITQMNPYNIPAAKLSRAVKRGALHKLGRRTGTWVRRWFVLYDDLSLHSCYTAAKEGAPGRVVDTGDCLFAPVPGGTRGRRHCFRLFRVSGRRVAATPGGGVLQPLLGGGGGGGGERGGLELLLAADSEDELNSWVTAILRLKSGPGAGTGGAMSRAKASDALELWLRRASEEEA